MTSYALRLEVTRRGETVVKQEMDGMVFYFSLLLLFEFLNKKIFKRRRICSCRRIIVQKERLISRI